MESEELGEKSREKVPDVFDHLERTEKLSGNPEPVHPPMQRHRVICVYLEQRKGEEKKVRRSERNHLLRIFLES